MFVVLVVNFFTRSAIVGFDFSIRGFDLVTSSVISLLNALLALYVRTLSLSSAFPLGVAPTDT